MQNRIHWVDNLRGLCMLAILFDHTEHYYVGENIVNLNLYVTDALCLFFMISGYLLYKAEGSVCLKHKCGSIVRSLIMPYFIFTTAMSLPKVLAHGGDFALKDIALGIVMGQASWFVAALAVAEVGFLVALRLVRGNQWALGVVCVVAFVASFVLSAATDSCVWQVDNALQAMLFLFVGYTYHRHEASIKVSTGYVAAALLVLIGIKTYVAMEGITLTIWHINVSNYAVFVANIAADCLAMFGLFRRLPPCKALEWMGRHSLVYYFLCGGVPLLLSKTAARLGFAYVDCYMQVVIVFVAVYAVASATTWAIYRYAPFVVGKKRGA